MAKKAFLVGINDYPGSGSDLKGCVNDVTNMRDILLKYVGFEVKEVRVLTDRRKRSVSTQSPPVVTATPSPCVAPGTTCPVPLAGVKYKCYHLLLESYALIKTEFQQVVSNPAVLGPASIGAPKLAL